MTETKSKALIKMLDEMSKEHTTTEDSIHNWLCDQNDDNLFKGVLKDGKSIKGSAAYCKEKAQKSEFNEGGSAMIHHDIVYGWVFEYFTSRAKGKKTSAKVKEVKEMKETETQKPKAVSVEQVSLFDL